MRQRIHIAQSGERQRVFIVGVRRERESRYKMQRSLKELGHLVDTAGGVVVGSAEQEIRRVVPATYLGRGKVEEIAEQVVRAEADLVVVDWELSPVQNRNLEEAFDRFVLDRTAVILDIFARRAHSREGKLQVELAQLQYLAPRLVGRGKRFSQQAGYIGTRGPGETALEYDRRRIRERVALLRRQLERVRAHRSLHRRKRASIPLPLVTLVGYTNAGKSTLLNALTDAGVFVEDKLFATLDPTVRRLRLPSGREILLADTVGFIDRLPHELVESFKSTFEEVAASQLLLHLIDGSNEEAKEQVRVVNRVLTELGLHDRLQLEIINKSDLGTCYYRGDEQALQLSALRRKGLQTLLERLDDLLRISFRFVELIIPLDRGDIISHLYRVGSVQEVAYDDAGVHVRCFLHEKQYRKYQSLAVGKDEPSERGPGQGR